jgi:hypothetical protein
MKLIFCVRCQDLFKPRGALTKCKCGESYGYYKDDGYHAAVGGRGVALGISNSSFEKALEMLFNYEQAIEFTAFTILPEKCDTVERID